MTTLEGNDVTTTAPSSNATLRLAVMDIDLQFYKGSIYKLRWGSPGGLDHAIPAYQDALRTVRETRWPDDLAGDADQLADYLQRYIEVLQKQDVTSVSGLFTPLMRTFNAIRDRVRVLPA